MLIDFHSHFNTNDPEMVRKFVKDYEERDVIACVVGGLNYGDHDMVPNDEVIQFCKKYPGRFYPLAKIDLGEQTPSLDEVRRYADLGTIITDAVGQYVTDVKSKDFPSEKESY